MDLQCFELTKLQKLVLDKKMDSVHNISFEHQLKS